MNKIYIPEELMDYIQMLFYEYTGVENVLNNILYRDLSSSKYEYSSSTKDHYLNELKNISIKLENAKNTVVQEFAPEWVNSIVSFDFMDCCIYIEDKGMCNQCK